MTTALRRWLAWTAAVSCSALLASACSSAEDTPSDNAADGAAEETDDAEDTEGGTGSGSSTGGASGIAGFLSSGFGGQQPASSAPGLSVSHTATTTMAADRAIVVVEPISRGIIGPGTATSGEDRKAIADAAAGLGIPAANVTFCGQGAFGGPRVQASVPVPAVPTVGQQFVDAARRVLGRAEVTGVVFGLSDCGTGLAPLRRQAFTAAEAKARELADAGSVRLAGVVSLTQQSLAGPDSFPLSTDPCDPSPSGDGNPRDLQPLDAQPEVQVSVTLHATWGLANQPPPAPGRTDLSALGRGSASAKADEAYVVVVMADEDGEGEPLSRADRDRTIAGITRLGIDKDDVDIATGSDYGPVTIVQVEVKLRDVEKKGPEIEKAVDEVLGRPYASGVRFWHSDCKDLLGRARKGAVADARSRAGALAEASGTRLGDLQAVSEAPVFPVLDPCDDDASALISLEDYTAAVQPFDGSGDFTVETGVWLSFGLAG